MSHKNRRRKRKARGNNSAKGNRSPRVGYFFLYVSFLIFGLSMGLFAKGTFQERYRDIMNAPADTINVVSENPVELFDFYVIDLSAYNSEPNQTDSTPWTTASGKSCKPGVIALSRDLLSEYTEGAPFSFGDKIMVIKMYGIFDVEDTMHKRKKMQGDVWKMERKDAYKFGVDEGVIIFKVN